MRIIMYLCGMDFFGGVARIALVVVVTRTQDELKQPSVNFFPDQTEGISKYK